MGYGFSLDDCRHQHQLVIAHQEPTRALLAEGDQVLNDASRVGAPIDIIPQKYQWLVGWKFLHQPLQGLQAAMNVADGYGHILPP